MNININVKNYVLLPREQQLLDTKLAFLEKILHNSKGNPSLDIDIEELSKITNNGERFKVSATFTFFDSVIHMEEMNHNLKTALDALFDDLKVQIVKRIKKYKSIKGRTAHKTKYAFLNKFLFRHKQNNKYTDDIM